MLRQTLEIMLIQRSDQRSSEQQPETHRWDCQSKKEWGSEMVLAQATADTTEARGTPERKQKRIKSNAGQVASRALSSEIYMVRNRSLDPTP